MVSKEDLPQMQLKQDLNCPLQWSFWTPSLPFTGKESRGASPKLPRPVLGTQTAPSSLCQPTEQLRFHLYSLKTVTHSRQRQPLQLLPPSGCRIQP